MMRMCCLLLALLLGMEIANGQGEIRFIASTNAEKVPVNQPFELQFVVENAEVDRFEPPDWDPLNKLSGPSRSNSIRIINGKKSSSTTYRYSLIASAPGSYGIAPATAYTNRGTLHSNSLNIDVVERSNQAQDEVEEIFLRLEPSLDSPYVGQQFQLQLVLYHRKGIDNIYKQNELDLSPFYSILLSKGRDEVEQSSINGIPYQKRVLLNYSLYPKTTGDYEVGPLLLKVDIPKKGQRRRFQFFRDYTRKDLASNRCSVYVRPLPTPIPGGFSGIVGKAELSATLSHRTIDKGEATELKVRLDTDSDPNIIDPPGIPPQQGLEVFSPQVLFENSREVPSGRETTKSWEFLTVPDSTGQHSLQPNIVYFDPEHHRYDTSFANEVSLFVQAASNQKADSLSSTIARQSEERKSQPKYSLWLWLGGALLLGFLAGIGWWWKNRRKTRRSSPNEPHTNKEALFAILQQPKPNLKELKAKLLQFKDHPHKKIPAEQVQAWIQKIDYFQYSPEADPSELEDFLDSIKTEVQKL